MPPSLKTRLIAHRLASPFSQPADYVFCTGNGTPHSHRNALRAVQRAARRAGLDDPSKPAVNFHALRHTYASIVISSGADIAHVSGQMGHKKISVTLDIYKHEWQAAAQGDRTRQIVEERFGALFQ